jgi:membrane protein YqaA with SNARE-associated domain
MRRASGASAPRALAAVSFAEASFFPVPPDVLLVPMMLARRDRAWILAGICTLASVAGGVAGYAIGLFLLETIGVWLIAIYGLQGGIEAFRDAYGEWGLWIILVKGLTPIPFKVVTIASGAARFDPVVFVLASLATRGARFFLVAALIRRFGAPIREVIERRLTLATTLLALVVVGGFVALRYVLPR